MADFNYKHPHPIYWFWVTHFKEENELLLQELRRVAPWTEEEPIWTGDDEDPLTNVNNIVYSHNEIIANENGYENFGALIRLLGTEITLKNM